MLSSPLVSPARSFALPRLYRPPAKVPSNFWNLNSTLMRRRFSLWTIYNVNDIRQNVITLKSTVTWVDGIEYLLGSLKYLTVAIKLYQREENL